MLLICLRLLSVNPCSPYSTLKKDYRRFTIPANTSNCPSLKLAVQKFSTNFPHLADNACLTDFCQHFLPQSFLPQKDTLMKFSLPLAQALARLNPISQSLTTGFMNLGI